MTPRGTLTSTPTPSILPPSYPYPTPTILSTVRALSDYSPAFFVLDGVISSCFLVDYALRVYASYEHHRFRPHGPIVGRLRWLLTWESPVSPLDLP